MTVSEDLFQLIKSLKQTEKRYFKIFASLHVKGTENNYLKLFVAVDKQTEYNESFLLKKFQNEVFVKQFAVTKNYLYKFILKSLRSYHSGYSVHSTLGEELDSATVLYAKGFYKKSAKIIKKSKKTAYKYEHFDRLVSLLELENKVYNRHFSGVELNKYLSDHWKEYENLLILINTGYQYRRLEEQIYSFYRNTELPRSKLEIQPFEDIINSTLMVDEANATSFLAKLSFNNIMGHYYSARKDFKKAAFHDTKQVEIYHNDDWLIQENLSGYIKALNNVLNNFIKPSPGNQFEKYIKLLEGLPDKYKKRISRSDIAKVFECSCNLRLKYYLERKDFTSALNMIPRIQKGLFDYEDILVEGFRINLYFTISKLYFFSGDINEAGNWVSKIVFEEKPTEADDLLCFARILNLLIHFELGNNELLKYEIRSTRRFLTRKKRLFQVEEFSLQYLSKLINLKKGQSSHQIFKNWSSKLQTLMNDPFEEHSSSYLNMEKWLESKVLQIPIMEVFKRNSEAE